MFCDVEPKRKALAAANAELSAAQVKLSKIKAKIKARKACFICITCIHTLDIVLTFLISLFQLLDDNLAELTAQFEQATAAKLKCQQDAEATASTISLANRSV